MTRITERLAEYAKLLDLPFVLRVLEQLSPFRTDPDLLDSRAAADPPSEPRQSESDTADQLYAEGIRLARERRIFVSAEAIGQVRTANVTAQRSRLVENLGVLIREGHSLHKVRALRAMRYIAGDDCLPYLERGLRDESAWVAATATRTFLRLNLRDRRARMLIVQVLFRWFFRATNPLRNDLLADLTRAWRSAGAWLDRRRGRQERPSFDPPSSDLLDAHPDGFDLGWGLIKGLARERGGWWLVLLAGFLWVMSIPLDFVNTALAFALFAIGALGTAIVGLGLAPIWPHLVRPRQAQRFVSILEVLVDYSLIVVVLRLVGSWSEAFVVAVTFACACAGTGRFDDVRDARTARLLARAVLLGYVGARSGAADTASKLLLAAALLLAALVLAHQILLAIRHRTASPLARFLKVAWGAAGGIVLGVLGIGGGMAFLAIAFSCWPVFLVIAEQFLVDVIRVPIAWSRRPFASLDERIAYVEDVVRHPWYPTRAKVGVVLDLTQVPLADRQIIDRLMDLADATGQTDVKDAIYQVVDAADRRVHRGQAVHAGKSIRSSRTATPGEVLRPWIVAGALTLVLASGGVLLAERLFQPTTMPDWYALGAAALGTLCVVAFSMTLGMHSATRGVTMAAGCALLLLVVSRPNQRALADQGYVYMAFWLPMWMTLAGAVAGHIAYLLESDTPIDPSQTTRRLVWFGVAVVPVTIAVAAQSSLSYDVVAMRSLRLPTIDVSRLSQREIELRDLPADHVVRVALNKNKSTEDETFPTIVGTAATLFFPRRQRAIHAPVAETFQHQAHACGEVWLLNRDGRIESWEPIEGGLLHVRSFDGGTARLSIQPGCGANGPPWILTTTFNGRDTGRLLRDMAPARLARRFAQGAPGTKPQSETFNALARHVWLQLPQI